MAIRYIVVPVGRATGEEVAGQFPVTPTLTRALVSQIDLRQLPADPAVAVYENTSWGPGRAVLPDRLSGSLPRELGAGADLSGGTPVLLDGGPVRYSGTVADGTVLVSEGSSGRWALSVDGDRASRQDAYGVASAYRPAGTGRAVLSYQTPLTRYGAILLQLALWALAVRSLFALRRRAVQLEVLGSRVTAPLASEQRDRVPG